MHHSDNNHSGENSEEKQIFRFLAFFSSGMLFMIGLIAVYAQGFLSDLFFDPLYPAPEDVTLTSA